MSAKPFTDEAHGGPELGTHDDVLVEKDVVLDISDRTHRSLDCAPLTVGRSRFSDLELSQKERGRLSRRHGALFVASLHINDNTDPSCRGAQLYVYPGNKTTKRLANEFAGPWARVFDQCAVIEAHKPPDPDEEGISEEERERRLEQKWINAPRSILLAHTCHVILFELGFRRNEHDRKILMSELGREEIASIMRWCLVRAAREYGG